MSENKFNEMKKFIENNYDAKDVSKNFENIHCPIHRLKKDGKFKNRFCPNIYIMIKDWVLSIFRNFLSHKLCECRLTSYGLCIHIRRFYGVVNLLNPFLEMMNCFKYPKNHFKLDFENKTLIINQRFKVIFHNLRCEDLSIHYNGRDDSLEIAII